MKPELFARVGIEPPKGVLLYGPPGTGKTLLAKAVANRTNASFIRIIGSELVQKYIGEGARMVRELFEMAKEKSPSIIFIDEIDSIGAKRLDSITSGDREVQRTLVQLLAEMDGFDPRGNVRILAATNRQDILDPALLRPGRFDRMIKVPMPNVDAREQILKIHARKMNLAPDVNLRNIAMITEESSGADLSAIVMEAGMFAIRNSRDVVESADFNAAVAKVLGERNRNMTQESGVMFA
jgi:proteasome regulatory subunit